MINGRSTPGGTNWAWVTPIGGGCGNAPGRTRGDIQAYLIRRSAAIPLCTSATLLPQMSNIFRACLWTIDRFHDSAGHPFLWVPPVQALQIQRFLCNLVAPPKLRYFNYLSEGCEDPDSRGRDDDRLEFDTGGIRLNWLSVLGIALGLAMDALAVAVAAGLVIPKLTHRHVFRMAFHFALFQFMMPVIGWSIGRTVSNLISAYDHWVAFGLLALIGCKMLWEAVANHQKESRGDPTRGWLLVTLSIATSIDALAVGLSMAFLGVSVWAPSGVIGVVTAILTTIGISFGSRIGRRFSMMAEIAGGIVLIAIGIRILVLHFAVG